MLPQIITTTLTISAGNPLVVLYTLTGPQADAVLLAYKSGERILSWVDTVTGNETVLNTTNCCYTFETSRVTTDGVVMPCETDCFITN